MNIRSIEARLVPIGAAMRLYCGCLQYRISWADVPAGPDPVGQVRSQYSDEAYWRRECVPFEGGEPGPSCGNRDDHLNSHRAWKSTWKKRGVAVVVHPYYRTNSINMVEDPLALELERKFAHEGG